MTSDSGPSLSRLVCSQEPVRHAFDMHRGMRAWWRVILLLHGKPTHSLLTHQERTVRVADGFRFYATLYRSLSILFVALCPFLFTIGFMDAEWPGIYWSAASLLSGLYLWGVSGLGYTGAAAYGKSESTGRTALLAFMVMIVAFLSMFVAAVSVVAQNALWLPSPYNLLSASALFVLGVGSYMIEILYLATDRQMSE